MKSRKAISIILLFSFIFVNLIFPSYAEVNIGEPENILEYADDMPETSSETSSEPTVLPTPELTASPTPEPTALPTPEPEPTFTRKSEDSEIFDAIFDITENNITIDKDGKYLINGNGTSTANTITVAQNVTADITIRNVVINAKSNSAMSIQRGSTVNLYLSGDNTLNTSASKKAGLAVTTTAGVETNLIISDSGEEEKGTLTATGGATGGGAGIGANQGSMCGNITINSGKVTALSAANNTGAAIGGGYNGASESAQIIINGGIVIAESGSRNAGIGGAYKTKFGSVIINGGYVKASGYTGIGSGSGSTVTSVKINGGNVNAEVKDGINQHNDAVEQIVLQMPEDKKNLAVTVMNEYGETWETVTDENAKIYLFASSNIINAVVTDAEGTIYYASVDLENKEEIYILSAYSGECSCTEENAEIKLSIPELTEPYEISVNKTAQQARVKLTATFINSPDCDYPIHGSKPAYTVTDIDGGEIDSSIANIENGYLTVYYSAVGNEIKITAKMTQNGKEYIDEQTVSIKSDDIDRYNLNDGSISITNHTSESSKLLVQVGSRQYTVSKTDPICIYQGNASPTSNTIRISATNVNLIFESLNIQTTNTSPVFIGENTNLHVTLSGNNTLRTTTQAAAFTGVNSTSSNLTIDGDGSLSAISNVGAGIGGAGGTITINSGTIYAEGGNGGAGIGGGADGQGRTVIINGGLVTAHGSDAAAGIGGGKNSAGIGGNVTINGGRVIADSDSGVGIGAGGASNHGTITINGGSVKGKLGAEPLNSDNTQVYLNEVSIEGVTGEEQVTYIIGDNDTPVFETATDLEGKLYLYLPVGRNWVRVIKNDVTYYKYMQTSKDEVATGTCVANPIAKITEFSILGQIGETSGIEEKEIHVKVPYNMILSKIKPTIKYEGANIEIAGNADFSQPVVYELTADDKSKVQYTVILEREDDIGENQPSIFDISKGNISFMNDYVDYAGTAYYNNENGYIIIGETDKNRILVDMSDEEADIDITLRDVKIINAAKTSVIDLYRNTKLTFEGNNEITSISEGSNAISITECDLDISGNGSLSINGGPRASGISMILGSTKVISQGKIKIAGGVGAPSVTGGSFVTDSVTNLHLLDGVGTTRTQAVNEEGTPLYQLVVQFDDIDEDEDKKVTYGDVIYDLDEDNAFYLMLPDGNVSMQLTLNEGVYIGDTEINKADTKISLVNVRVTEIRYNNEVTSEGGELVFEFFGNIINNRVKIKLVPTDNNHETIEEMVVVDTTGAKAVVNIPENEDPVNNVVYRVSYEIILNDTETFEDFEKTPNNIVVSRNKTICRITSFTLPNQIGESEIEDNRSEDKDGNPIGRVVVYFPYDYTLAEGYYSPSISIIGERVTPSSGYQQWFKTSGSTLEAQYNVLAKDNNTMRIYNVSLRNQAVPKITSLLFSNPDTYKGGEVTVRLYGTALPYIKNAYAEKNRKVFINADGLNETEAIEKTENNTVYYEAVLNVPENDNDISSKEYVLKITIGDEEQTLSNNKIIVPRKAKNITDITSFTLPNQIGQTVFDGDNINIIMPYDVDITSIHPTIRLKDNGAVISPSSDQNFTNPVVYTVLAEDKVTTRQYTVNVTKQEEPRAVSVDFTNPVYSSAGRIKVKINGTNLENAVNAVNHSPNIEVSARPSVGIISGKAEKDASGNFVAVLFVPQNEDTDNTKQYEITVSIGEVEQTLSGNTTLTVPAKESNQKQLVDMVFADNQTEDPVLTEDNTFIVYVPYNTNLNDIEPKVVFLGESYEPTGKQTFRENEPIDYTIHAADGTSSIYHVKVIRSDVAQVNGISFDTIEHFADTKVDVDISGKFIPFVDEADKLSNNYKDKLEITASLGDTVIQGTIDYNEYSGKATGHLNIPPNLLTEPVTYTIEIKLNDVPQTLGLASILTVPARKTRMITSFRVNNQIGLSEITEDDENGNTIEFTMPYNTDLTALLPLVTIDGDSYTPETEQDFDKKDVVYSVSANGDTDRKYKVTANRYGLPSIDTVTVTNIPETYIGSKVHVDVTGTFFYGMKVKAVPNDESETIEGTVTMNKWHEASAEIDIPVNYNTENAREYTLEFYLDGFEQPISYLPVQNITVPRRKTRAIKSFTVDNQAGSAEITETDVYVQVIYDTDISDITPVITIDGDSYTPEGVQNFDNDTKTLIYKVSAKDDEDRTYTVHISRYGKPSLSNVTYSQPVNFRDISKIVDFEGIFFEDAYISAIAKDGSGSINGETLRFEDKQARAQINLPINYDTENPAIYELRFLVDGFNISYINKTEIIVPRRKTRQITEFSLPGIQEGDTRIEGTDIYIDVPYTLDITSVTPEITYDADNISPSQDTPQNFGNLDNPVKYTLSASGDENITYTIHIRRIGDDPYITSFTANKQAVETTYDGDNIMLTLKSNGNLKEVEPIVEFHGKDYSPKGPQDFSKSKKEPLKYTVVNKYGVERIYYVTIDKRAEENGGKASGNNILASPKPTEQPETTPYPTEEPVPTETPVFMPYIKGYEELGLKLFKPENTITRAEVAAIMSLIDGGFDEMAQYPNAFDDVSEGAWYSNYVNYAAEKGYIRGYDDGMYRPENNITRAEFASIIARYIGVEQYTGMSLFKDIDNISWCRNQINALAKLGIVNGYDNAMFMPDKSIIRAEAVVMINRAINRVMTEEIKERLNNPFDDVNSEYWAYDDILLASCEY